MEDFLLSLGCKLEILKGFQATVGNMETFWVYGGKKIPGEQLG